MNAPYRIGDRWRCFEVIREDKGWGGPYGQVRKPTVWRCVDCSFTIPSEMTDWSRARMADHHECGHSPCPACGQKLLRRKDGTPRQHAHNRCPGKTPGHKIEREYVKNMTERELA